MKQATRKGALIWGILLPFFLHSQDSLFTSTDKPVSTWEDNPLTLGMTFTVSKPGVITALKFYKTSATTATFNVTLWNSSSIVTTQVVSTSRTGWIRVPVSAVIQPGKYLLSVYNPVGRYGYTNNLYPRSRGSIIADSGKFSYGNAYPTRNGTCYYLDVVFSGEQTPPAKVTLPDSLMFEYGINSITLGAKVENQVSYNWEILDSAGSWQISGLSSLSPVIQPKDEGGCWLLLMLTVRGADGTEVADVCEITVLPNPNEIIGYIKRNGTIMWRRRIVIP